MIRTTAAAVFCLCLTALSGCAHESWTYKAVTDVNVARADDPAGTGPLLVQTASSSSKSPPQTVLVATWHKQSGGYDSSISRTLLILLNGEPHPGQYWLTSDNTILVTHSAFSAPSRERVSISGSVKIIKVDGNAVVADVAARDTTPLDSAEYVERPYDPSTSEWPFSLVGRRTFTITTPADPGFDPTAIKPALQ